MPVLTFFQRAADALLCPEFPIPLERWGHEGRSGRVHPRPDKLKSGETDQCPMAVNCMGERQLKM